MRERLRSPMTHSDLRTMLASIRNKGPSMFFSTFRPVSVTAVTFRLYIYSPCFVPVYGSGFLRYQIKIFKPFNEIKQLLL